MGCDWIQFDKDLEKKPEFLALRAATGEDEATVGWRLKKFWSWVDDHVPPSGRVDRVMTRDALALMFGGGQPFWQTLEDVGWLASDENGLRIPDHKKRFGKSAKARKLTADRSKRYRDKKKSESSRTERDASRVTVAPESRGEGVTDHDNHALRKEERRKEETRGDKKTSSGPASSLGAPNGASAQPPHARTLDALKGIEGRDVDWEDLLPDCRRLVAAMGTERCDAPSDRELVAKVAALVRLGAISEHERSDACVAVQLAVERDRSVNHYAYLHSVIASKLAERQVTFNRLLAAITVPAGLRQPKPKQNPEAQPETEDLTA